jgi:hypothetical protein
MPQNTLAQPQPTMLNEADWKTLLGRIREQKCTPFLGAESSGGVMPSRSSIAGRWATDFDFPLENPSDLARVAQFIATKFDALKPCEMMIDEIEKIPPPDFKVADEPHSILASLPLPIYVTTDYHNFMFAALKNARRDARQELCRWNKSVKDMLSAFDTQPGKGETSSSFPDVANPVVFHLYGHTGVAESLVLTEDDYLKFLIETSRSPQCIPPPIQAAFTRTSLFLGYRLTDLEFRVLLRSLAELLTRSGVRHMSVQVIQVGDEPQTEKQLAQLATMQEYLTGYCKECKITTYWGTTRDFLVELKQRWDAFAK